MSILSRGFSSMLVSRPARAAFGGVAPVLGGASLAFGVWYATAGWSLVPYPSNPVGLAPGELDGAPENVAEGVLVGLREGRDRLGWPAQALDHVAPDFHALGSQRECLDPTVVACTPFDEATGLEPIGEAGHVRGVADETLGNLAHREGSVGVEQPERMGLRKREVDLLEGSDETRPIRERELEKELPCLARRRRRTGYRRHDRDDT